MAKLLLGIAPLIFLSLDYVQALNLPFWAHHKLAAREDCIKDKSGNCIKACKRKTTTNVPDVSTITTTIPHILTNPHGTPTSTTLLEAIIILTSTSIPPPLICDQSNCLREFIRYQDVFLPFCETYTQGVRTETVGVGVPRMDNCPGGSGEVSSACWCLPLYTTGFGETTATVVSGSVITATTTSTSSPSISVSSRSSATESSARSASSTSRSTPTSSTQIVAQSFGIAVDDEISVIDVADFTTFAGETIIVPEATIVKEIGDDVMTSSSVLPSSKSMTELSVVSEFRGVVGLSYATVVVTETVYVTGNGNLMARSAVSKY